MKQKSYEFSLNKLIISGLVILLVGFGGGYLVTNLEGLKSQAHCRSETNDVNIYLNHLIGILQNGGNITHRQMNTLLDLIEIENDCYRSIQLIA